MTLALVLGAAAALSLAMWGAWASERLTGKSGWIDSIWSAATGLVAIMALALLDTGEAWRRWAAMALVALWCLRLAGHIAARNFTVGDDPRYKALREEWGSSAAWRLAWFLQVQAAAGLVLVVSVLAAASNPAPFPHWLDVVAIAVALAALAGETLADAQLSGFRSRPKPKPPVMEEGLWAFSRHPNYFFEWMFWTAWPLLALAGGTISAQSLLAFAAPVQMYVLLVHVSGIPPLEKHMLASRGQAFRDLQARVNAFFPGPRKTG